MELREKIRQDYLLDEEVAVQRLLDNIVLSEQDSKQISATAKALVEQVRAQPSHGVMQSFLAEYGLSTDEGVALMCLAEALLRVPDNETIDDLIEDKIVPHDWGSHVGDSGSILVNASTWALMLTGKVLDNEEEGIVGLLRGLFRRLGEPVIRSAIERVMREMGEQFVLGENIELATDNAQVKVNVGYTYSYDMLGESAITELVAEQYLASYLQAIKHIAKQAGSMDLRVNPGISVKLSALHSRYEGRHIKHSLDQICSRLLVLAKAAAKANVGLNIDAEEANRLDFSLDIFAQVIADESLGDWQGFGLVVQAYGKRALAVIDWVYQLSIKHKRKVMLRLVKGAYWDSEIKHAQVLGLDEYAVYTRKSSTDLSFLACAQKLLSMREQIYPQFATHNAHTIAAVLHMAGKRLDNFEFQHLHGMGQALHELVKEARGVRCRIYAPVGSHENLLAYLVRRLLENGANSSFVNQIVDNDILPEHLVQDPIELTRSLADVANPAIVQPMRLFGKQRVNSCGWDLNDPHTLTQLQVMREPFLSPYVWAFNDESEPSKNAKMAVTPVLKQVHNPADIVERVGSYPLFCLAELDQQVAEAVEAQCLWQAAGFQHRRIILLRSADLFEQNAAELSALLSREAGKNLVDAMAEIRESVDFLRYYACFYNNDKLNQQAMTSLTARGVIVCISPWNFPLAIFTGQLAAALITGNSVLAKPSEQTPLIASRAIELLFEAGVPQEVLQLMLGAGATLGAALTSHPDISGVCFTGSGLVAKAIEESLSHSSKKELMLIAETGGINAMIVDSTALLEQAVSDVVSSAFQSAGQRCSALRMLYVQEEIEGALLELLFGAMDSLVITNPIELEADIGPLIDVNAQTKIKAYCQHQQASGALLYQLSVPESGYFVAPCIIRVAGIGELKQEVFGPVLHVARFSSDELDSVVKDINRSGYGLTMGLHTRIDGRVQDIVNKAMVGNFYVNRNQVGAVVGSQPFGGEGLSGTGPKAGGPHYLRHFMMPCMRVEPGQVDDNKHGLVDKTKSELADSQQLISLEQLTTSMAEMSNLVESENGQQIATLRRCLRGKSDQAMSAAASVDMGPIDLPGPTGESNQLSLHPLGLVICLSDNADRLLDMAVQALCCGNKVLVIGQQAAFVKHTLHSAELMLHTLEGNLDISTLARIEFDALAVDETYNCGLIRQVLSASSGAIKRLITQRIYPTAYALERVICIDITAAGGNTELLVAADSSV